MRFAALVLAVAVLAAAPAMAQTDPTPPPAPAATGQPSGGTEATAPAQQAEQPAEEEQICRTVQRAESRLRTRRERICGTRDQWEAMQDQNAREVNRVGSVQNAGNQ